MVMERILFNGCAVVTVVLNSYAAKLRQELLMRTVLNQALELTLRVEKPVARTLGEIVAAVGGKAHVVIDGGIKIPSVPAVASEPSAVFSS